jgi:hypothetical protein
MNKFSVTYELVNEEEAEAGGTDRCEFIAENLTLGEAMGILGGYADEADSYPMTLANPPRWFTSYREQDWRTGDYESRSLHIPEHVTPSSRLRIARLLGVRS